MPALIASSSSFGGVSAISIIRQASAILAVCSPSPAGAFGLQRLQARKPAASASSFDSWKLTFSRSGRRAVHEGRQYMPVVLTAVTNVPSAALSRATTAAQRLSSAEAGLLRVLSAVRGMGATLA